MECMRFQYELNKKYFLDSDPELCKKGFHFCKTLEEVYGYYPKNGYNRFFKVKAFVPRESWLLNSDKYIAKEIKLIEEVKYNKHDAMFQSLKGVINDLNIDELNYNMPSLEDHLEYILEKRIENLGFSNMFTEILKENTKYKRTTRDYNKTINLIKFATALKDENVSNDMRVYLILKQINKLN